MDEPCSFVCLFGIAFFDAFGNSVIHILDFFSWESRSRSWCVVAQNNYEIIAKLSVGLLFGRFQVDEGRFNEEEQNKVNIRHFGASL